ncbi:NAD+ synthase [candidate division KSB1 bacterium]
MPDSGKKKKSAPVDLTIDTDAVIDILKGFIEDSFSKTAARKAVVGLSGGLDSSVVAVLAVRALGTDRVLGVIMPYKTSAPESRTHAQTLAAHIGIQTHTVDITPMVDSYFENHRNADDVRRGNFMARQRMAVLYDISARERGLVIGTSNKSELLLGYGTIFGDIACAVNPVGDLYKTQIQQLAEALEIPGEIRLKVPTADLVKGQTDEGDLGFSYEEADRLLYLLIDRRFAVDEVEKQGYDAEMAERIMRLVRKNHFKRIPPLIAKLSSRTIGHEFRYAWDWSSVDT